MEDELFERFWELFNPDPEFNNRRAATHLQWQKCSDEKKAAIIKALTEGKQKSSRNPYFYVQDFRFRTQQVMSFNEYYQRFGTTKPRDGWQQANPTGNKVIYIKTN